MKKHHTKQLHPKKLTVDKTALRSLNTEELGAVQGGNQYKPYGYAYANKKY